MGRQLEENHLLALTSVALLRMLIRWVTQPKKQPLRRKLRTSDLVVEIPWRSRRFEQVRWFSI